MASVGALVSILHWAVVSVAIVLKMAGSVGGSITTFDRWNLFLFEPWFLGMGILLSLVAAQNRRTHARPASPALGGRSHAERGSTVLILAGVLLVIGGVMAFEAWMFAVVGPGVICVGALRRMSRRAERLG